MKNNPTDRADLERGRAQDPLVRVTGLHHVVLACPDLDVAERFYCDFGLTRSASAAGARFMRARGRSHHVLELLRAEGPRLVAVAMQVESELDLRKLASLPEAEPDANWDARAAPIPAPGGGRRVRLVAPGGLLVDAIHGVEELAALPTRASFASNVMGGPGELARAGRPVRLPSAPSEVLRIGHAAVESPRPVALVLWLMRTLGMIVSDYQPLDACTGAIPIATFLRCDRGRTPTDHHTLAVALAPRAGLAHVAFEVSDVDEVGRGHTYLSARGYRHAWGVGRHILGSQLFDYWRAPDGLLVEHYCDGDVFDAASPTGRLLFSGSNLAQWGGPPPRDFTLPPMSAGLVAEAVRGIATSDEVSLSLLAAAARALSR